MELRIIEPIRLDQVLKLSGLVQTGSDAKMLIKSEEVLVNDEICTMRGKKLYGGDRVECLGETIQLLKKD